MACVLPGSFQAAAAAPNSCCARAMFTGFTIGLGFSINGRACRGAGARQLPHPTPPHSACTGCHRRHEGRCSSSASLLARGSCQAAAARHACGVSPPPRW
uniref:Uncharacterized protein n=1 Tax=Chlamydomonas euryale TaxID=1486919 RepID=A0A7R9VS93_9CHLO